MSVLIGIPTVLGITNNIEACVIVSIFFSPFAILVPFVEDDSHSNRVVIEKKSL
jgi:hypothetical protein